MTSPIDYKADLKRRNSTMADTIDIRKEAWLSSPGAHIGPDEEVAA